MRAISLIIFVKKIKWNKMTFFPVINVEVK